MLSSLFFLILGSLGLYFGSEYLIDGAKSLAKKLKVTLFSTPFSERAVDFLEKLNTF